MARPRKESELTPELARAFTEARSMGKTPSEICKARRIPLNTYYSWCHRYLWFKEDMQRATADYAQTQYDVGTSLAARALKEDDPRKLQSIKLAFEILQWTTSRADPSRFSPTSQVVSKQEDTFIDALKAIQADGKRATSAPSKPLRAVERPSPSITAPGTDTEQ